MSLRSPDDEYSELVPQGGGRINRFMHKARPFLIVFIIGVFAGVVLLHYVNTNFFPENKACSSCEESRTLLNQENNCLYSLVPNPQAASQECARIRTQQTQGNVTIVPKANTDINALPATPPKDFNEEPSDA